MPDPKQKSQMPEKTRRENPENVPLPKGREETGLDMSSSVSAFCEQIARDAHAEIEKIAGRAKLSAKRKLEEAEKKADTAARQIKQAAEVQAKGIQARVTSGISLETKKILLRAQADIIEEVFAKVRQRLKTLKGATEYIAFLKELTVQAILVLEEEECLLAPGTDVRQLYTAQLMSEISQLVQRRTGKEVKLSLSPDLSPKGPGVRVYSGARTALFDNTLEARMERLEDELKAVVATEVFASQPRSQSKQAETAQTEER